MPYVLVEIDLAESDTRDLIEELESRSLSKREQGFLLDIIETENPKIKLFMKVMEHYSLYELEQMFNDSNSAISNNCKEQLKLEL